jgi:predicted alpha/beta superfamily hydrolase
MKLLLLLSTVLTTSVYSQMPPPGPPVEIPGTEVQRLTSSIDGQEYVLYVSLPPEYSQRSKTFPVLYLLDAQWDFPMVVGLVGSLADDAFVPPLIIVGITWGGRANPNYSYLRFKDLTPTNSPRIPQSGNGPSFLRFMKNELVPFVESKYRTTQSERAIMGNSLGGTFELYALFTEPDLFNRYVVSSPNLALGGGIASYEETYAAKHSQLAVRLAIAVGDLEGPHIGQVQHLDSVLKARKYQGLELETLVIKSAGHSSNKPEGFVRGLQAVFAPRAVTIDPRVLDEYVGVYQFPCAGMHPGYSVAIQREKEGLYVVLPEGTKFLLNPQTERDFYTRGVYMVVHFRRDNGGTVVGLDADQQSGGQESAVKTR